MTIFQVFKDSRNELQAELMAKYMKEHFSFLGIKKPERAALSKEFLKERKNDRQVDWEFIYGCFEMTEREFQYLAIDYMEKVIKLFVPEDMERIQVLLLTKSWWDSVDAINKIVGSIAMKFPEVKEGIMLRWMKSDNIWLNRISILFQLRYKERTDTNFLSKAILYHSQSEEFFINKAIGWALREYSKTNKVWVKDFVNNYQLSPLSVREASKYIGRDDLYE